MGYDTISFSYDANGNTIQKNDNGIITDYSYDIEDRLVEVTTNNPQPTTYRYHYDPFGRRLWKEVDGTRTYFVYSDEGLVGEYDSTGQELRTYGWIPGSGWSTDPLFVKIEGVYYWYRNDHLGTPQKIVTTSGAVVWEAVYDSFGNCQIQVEAITNNLRFPGQYYDSETGLCYNLNRYYDPTTGRYLRADPFGSGLNLYVYCFNNPLGLIDPQGLCALKKGVSFTKQLIRRVLDQIQNRYSKTRERVLKEYSKALKYYEQDVSRFSQNLKYMRERGLITFGFNQSPEEFREARARTRRLIEMLDVSTQGLGKVTVAFDVAGALAPMLIY